MYKLGLIGYPLGHSISGAIQKAGLKSIGLDGTYDVMETPPDELIDRIKFIKHNGYDGFNVTIPLKVPMSLFVDDIDDNANIIGCVNTIKVLSDKGFYGYNTDIYGFKAAIPKSINLKDKNVSILGTGGASRAAAAGVAQLGAKEIDFYTRNILNSSQAVNYMREKFPNVIFNVYQIQNMRNISHTAMLVNTTPIGMRGHSADKMPVEEFTINQLADDAVVYDVVYNPTKTLLLETAEKRGLQTINGLDMLINQGAKSLEIWTGKVPDLKEMKIAALEAL